MSYLDGLLFGVRKLFLNGSEVASDIAAEFVGSYWSAAINGTTKRVDVKLTAAANKFLARSSVGDFGEKTISDFGLSLVDDANAAAARTTLGITGTVAALQTYTVGTLPSPNTMTNQIALVSDGLEGVPCLAYSDGVTWWAIGQRIGRVAAAATTYTIAAGAITVVGGSDIVLETEGAAATDDLTTINGTVNKQLVTLRTVNSARDVVVKDSAHLRIAGDCTLGSSNDRLVLRSDGTNLFEISRSTNG